MGLVKTEEELAKYYGLGVRKFLGARMLGVMFGTRPEVTQRLLPPPLEQADMPGGLIFIAEYPETNLGLGYREAALFVRCKYRGEPGGYCLSMPIDNEARMHNGRDIFGFPKKMAQIHLERSDEKARGWVERNGKRFVEISIKITGRLPELPPTGPTYLFKAMPRIDLTPGFDGPVFLASQKTAIEPKTIEIGSAELILNASEDDPWAEMEDPRIMTAFYLVSDNTMLPGKILTEVDPKAFLPHYFRMTDFSAGETPIQASPRSPAPAKQAPKGPTSLAPKGAQSAASDERAPGIDFSLTEDQQVMVKTAREFGREILKPAEIELDKMAHPDEVFRSELFWKILG